MPLLPKGTATLHAEGMPIVVEQLLGDGGQGEVYLVKGGTKSYALKWLFPQLVTPRRKAAFEKLVQIGSPDNRFLWPLAVVRDRRAGRDRGLGYIMELRDDRFVEIKEFLRDGGRLKRRLLAKAIAEAADSLWNLHANGLVYGDLNEDNFFVDGATGELQICDTDNIAVERRGEPLPSDVLGRLEFMAPEVVRNEVCPNKHTDKHSLAVLLFYMFTYSHPFEGDIINQIPGFDPNKGMTIYGKPAAFVFHPTDRSNPPCDPVITKRWNALPKFMRNRFVEAFVEKVNKPSLRVSDTAWRADLLKLHDVVVDCPHCGYELFWDGQVPSAAGGMGSCPGCAKPVPSPLLLRLTRGTTRQVLAVTGKTRLYSPHIDDSSTFDLRSVRADVVAHPKDPRRIGLRNLSGRPWISSRPGGSAVNVGPNQVVELANGLTLQFGQVRGEVRC